MASTQALRRPAFLGRTGGNPKVENAAFKTTSGTRFRPPVVANEDEDDGEANRRAAETAIAEAEKYDIIFQEAVYASPRIDITEKVIKALEDKPAGK